ncbi:MAG TPA: cysteine--tRNA ligase [Kiritimatiellae bacterium]|nr:cysteine--tRNA ligase [Kiritimatiellia bacterium]
MGIRFFNTLTRTIAEFEPLVPAAARIYTCGPTVYDYAHIGNFRAYVFEDLLRRYLQFRGYRVTQVMNLTDVDDKTIRSARQEGMSLNEFTARYKRAFFEDLETLNIERVEFYPAATEHVGDMIALIETLIRKGHAYVSGEGSVYFDISSFPNYGRLSRVDTSGLKAGARVVHDEYGKQDVADFALWKAWDEADGDVSWESPWGRGRPGWHIECSAMSMKYLGETFDIHTGGIDNIFPHHENEIAQSEAATGKPFVRYWLHCAHLIVEGQKMSKSLGNFYTLRDLLRRGYSGREVRFVLIGTHYRQSLNFTLASLDAARNALARIDDTRRRLQELAYRRIGPGADQTSKRLVSRAEERFVHGLDDDLNVAPALAALFDLLRDVNRALDRNAITSDGASLLESFLTKLDRVWGFLEVESQEQPDQEVRALVQERERQRGQKNWAEADKIRDRLLKMGWIVQDTPDGPHLRRAK